MCVTGRAGGPGELTEIKPRGAATPLLVGRGDDVVFAHRLAVGYIYLKLKSTDGRRP